MIELRDPEAARDWVAAGLQLVRVGETGSAGIAQASGLIQAANSECRSLPPLGFLIDVGRLLTGEAQQVVQGPRSLAAVLRRYDDQVLGRIAVHPLREEVGDALRGLEPALRPVAIALLVEAMLHRIGFEQMVAVAPEAIEDLDRLEAGAWMVRGAAAVRGTTAEDLEGAYQELLARFAQTAEALAPAELTLVQRLAELRGRADRLALIQLVDASAKLREGLPRTVRAGRRHAGHVPTIVEDESSYPVGGFASITTRGSLENLVPSELAGMEDGPEIDLFDVRYAENELLYYTRDESSFVRTTRHVFVVLDGSLDANRHRDRALPWQVRIVGFAFVRALVLQLERWLSNHELYITVVWPTQGLSEDERILAVALQQQIHGGWVKFARGDCTAAMVDAGRRAPTDVIHLRSDDSAVTAVDKTWTTVLRVRSVPELVLPRGRVALGDVAWDGWMLAFGELARDLV